LNFPLQSDIPRKTMAKKSKTSSLSLLAQNLFLIGWTSLLSLSLVSYRINAPSHNLLGLVGHLTGWAFTYLFGLSSLLIPPFLFWICWRRLKKLELPPLKIVAFFCLLLSSAIIFSLLSYYFPKIALLFKNWAYSNFYPTNSYYDPSKYRTYLGGVPFHHLFLDFKWSLSRIIGFGGTFILFLSLGILSLGLLFEWSFSFSKCESFFKKVFLKITSNRSKSQKIPAFAQSAALSLEEEALPPLYREDPLKPVTRIRIAEPPVTKYVERKSIPLKDFGSYKLPSPSLLTEVKTVEVAALKNDLRKQAEILEEALASFGIEAKVGDIHCGPTITLFEVHPAVGVKVQKIKTLENDIALNLQAKSIRIIAPIPGKAAVGIEIPSPYPQEVSFRKLVENYLSSEKRGDIPLLLGKKVNGEDVWADLAKMPHLIIAGATGSGKSVCVNTIVMSILMNAHPEEIKLIMVDPKKVELSGYTALPHMIAPVITEPKSACAALQWLVKEMEKRYEILRLLALRNIQSFNTRKVNKEVESSLHLEVPEKMPFIVLIIDELADLMMVSSSDIETPIARIAQMARAVGIHMILATQRPSREVITGLIKANFPCSIAFKVSSRINSQIIIGEGGAETLLGNGDMLFAPPGTSNLVRAQGAFIRDEDIQRTVQAISDQLPARYLIPSFDQYRDNLDTEILQEASIDDPLFSEAKKIVLDTGNASTTFLQRKLKIGYARAASLMDLLEIQGIIGPSEGAKPRRIFHPNQLSENEE